MSDTDTRGGDGTAPPSLMMVLRALFDDAQTLLAAETGYWRTALAYLLGHAKTIALLLVLALFLVFFTLMAIVVGLLLALAPLIGAWGALGAVSLTLVLLAALCAWLAIGRIRHAVRMLTRSSGDGT